MQRYVSVSYTHLYENGAVEVVLYYDDVYQEMCQSILEMQKKKEANS